ncbi:hypothetical protein GCM10023184_05910 [Flaviaesturariibacter amylovorans]|uniref:DUF4476 domain-containing protein n=1 Tax=Flaviaesturariibacter amylovorans TaxID=1084520 RepID=A0ABP8GAP9_9BACT
MLIGGTVVAQSPLQGNWYSFGRDRVIRFSIRKDSLINQHLNWDGSPRLGREQYRQAFAIFGSVKEKDVHCLRVRHLQEGETVTSATCFRFPGADKKQLWLVELPAAVPDTAKKGPEIPYMRLISEAEMQRLRKLPRIDSMTAADFRKYIGLVNGLQQQLNALERQGVDAGTIRYEAYSRIRSCAAALGYDPFYTDLQYMRVVERFRNDPETKSLVEKLFKD